ncbi:MAG: hypothetical protein LIP01_03000 [Tannerellaceae bacterium]|nr:hypothetical protein [Tannerellaceae bacterium]
MNDFIFLLLTGFCIGVEVEAILKAKIIILCQYSSIYLDANGKEKFFKEHPDVKRFLSLSFFYWIVCVAGLFTSQWYCFLIIIILSIIPRRKRTITIHIIDSVVCIAAMVLAILLNLKIV